MSLVEIDCVPQGLTVGFQPSGGLNCLTPELRTKALRGCRGERDRAFIIQVEVNLAHQPVGETEAEILVTQFFQPLERPHALAPRKNLGFWLRLAVGLSSAIDRLHQRGGRMNRSIHSRSDLYSLGVTLYEVLTGTLPFRASDPMEWVHCHIAREPVSPGERFKNVPASISAVIMKLLAKTPEERYQV